MAVPGLVLVGEEPGGILSLEPSGGLVPGAPGRRSVGRRGQGLLYSHSSESLRCFVPPALAAAPCVFGFVAFQVVPPTSPC